MWRLVGPASGIVLLLSIVHAGPPAIAEDEVPMTVAVAPRSQSRVFRGAALVYLDGKIDDGAPDRLSRALEGIDGKIEVWLNSPGGNLFAGMQLGRIMRKHGAWTHIIDSRTLLPGECYSACALAFLGGVHRFNDNGARYGVHRASLRVGSSAGDVDLGQHLASAIAGYIREMGVDARLLDLWAKAGPQEMYVLSWQEAERLRVVDNGRTPPTWSIVKGPGGTLLQGRQATTGGTGTVSFSCDSKQTVLDSVYDPADKGKPLAPGEWSHLLTIDRREERPLGELGISGDEGVIRARFIVSSSSVRLAMSAKRIGHRMKPSGDRSLAIGYSVDVDAGSVSMVKRFLGDCLRRQARSVLPP